MKNRPNLLILTGSFPRSPDDETCGYVRGFARSLAAEFDVQVLAPPDSKASDGHVDTFRLARSKSLLPERVDPFQASRDFNDLLSSSLAIKAASAISLLSFFAKAFRLALKSDAVCSHWMLPSGLAGALVSRALGRPHIVIEHSGALHLLAQLRGGRSVARFIVNNSDLVITVSADLKDKLTELCPEAAGKIEVIPMGIRGKAEEQRSRGAEEQGSRGAIEAVKPEPSHPCPPAPLHPCVLFIGRLTEIKGVGVLLRAMKEIDDAQLIIAGDGEMREELYNLARDLSVDARFLGQVGTEERDRLLAACDCVVIPSLVLPSGRTEGMPVVCLEAMAAGQAVIASRAGGLAEVIVDGYNGLLFEPGDHLMLAERLKMVLSDGDLKLRLGRAARKTAARFEWPQTGLRFSEIIKSILRSDERVYYDQGCKTRRADL
ncbi:MAG: glycosyltransferase family 4 protein [Blastocatellia bacterium]|nr:glycosyltransferase family 4 protein [Blastocatellia bacterium]